jgi:MFS transporter, TsgA protein
MEKKKMEDYRSKANLIKLTILSYSLTFIVGIAVTLPFLLKQPVAAHFNASLEAAGTIFSCFMFGMLINEFLNGYLVKYIKVKQEIFLAGLVFAACVIAMFYINSIYTFGVLLFIVGLCFGVLVHIPNTLIVHAFDKKIRSVKLNRLDLFFSIGSFVYPFIAGAMLASLFSFQQVYSTVLVIVLFIFFMTCISKLPDLDSASDNTTNTNQHFSKWNINIFIVFFVLIFYFLSYISFTYWIVDYLTSILHINVQAANTGYAMFWIFYGIGCFISSFAVQYIKVGKYILYSIIVSFIAYILVYYSVNTIMMYISISLLGLGCATVYSSSLSFGSLQILHPSPRLMSFYICGTGIATWLGEICSSYVQSAYGIKSIIIISSLLMLVAMILQTVVLLNQKIVKQ